MESSVLKFGITAAGEGVVGCVGKVVQVVSEVERGSEKEQGGGFIPV